jgi:hypothetical protein
VLHAPTSTGGNPQGLSRALNSLGIDSTSLDISQNHFAYPSDIVLHSGRGIFLYREIKRIWAIFFILPKFNIIHFNSGTTIACAYRFRFTLQQGFFGLIRLIYTLYLCALQQVELLWLKLLNRPIFMTYQGDDARQGDYCLTHFSISIATQVDESYYCKTSDLFKRRSIDRMSKIADQIYAVNPDLMHVLPLSAKFIPYSHILLNEWRPKYINDESRPLRILHAPSNRKVKGTDLILASLNRLKNQGYKFEIILVENIKNDEARKLYEDVDVLIDQLFAGWYGGLAVELMALGKPVLVYIREGDLKFIPSEMKDDLPFIHITPDTLDASLSQLLSMPKRDLILLGKKSRAFVERWHDPLRIAQIIKADYEIALCQRHKEGV